MVCIWSSDYAGGVVLTYTGAPPVSDDPFLCPWNPATGQQYPFQVSMVLLCNVNVNGAIEVAVSANSSMSCEYVRVLRVRVQCQECPWRHSVTTDACTVMYATVCSFVV